MRKKQQKRELSFVEIMQKLKKAGIKTNMSPQKKDIDDIEQLDERVKNILEIFNSIKKDPTKMIFFVMYDIENNKVRYQIAKYLIKKGCIRIQKSVYLAKTDRKTFDQMHSDLKEVQEIYENTDSIIFIPVPTDSISNMKIIGEKIDISLIIDNPNTLFF